MSQTAADRGPDEVSARVRMRLAEVKEAVRAGGRCPVSGAPFARGENMDLS